MQHQVQRGRAAAGGDPVAVDDKAISDHLYLGKRFFEDVVLLPVDGGSMTVQQAGPGQRVAAGVESADGPERPGFLLERTGERGRCLPSVVVTRQQEQHVCARDVGKSA